MKAIDYTERWRPTPSGDRLEVVVTLPLRITSPMNGSHGHWASQARRRKQERRMAAWGCGGPLAEYRRGLAQGQVTGITITISRTAPRALDDDNLRSGAKSVRDGITDALGLKDDRDPRLTWEYAQERGAPKQYLTRITVTRST